MDYQLENLGDERFQEMCQSLLAQSFPNMQCFPIGQRDGGRDAITYFRSKGRDGFIVFQVKFVRKPLALKDPHKWLAETIQKEVTSVAKLVPKGAKQYYLLTNVPGTAFPESGSIDRVQSILTDALGVRGQCWWREDINRRLDDAWNLKWAYPDILSGLDVLRYIVEEGLSEDAQRRTSAIRAFVSDQHTREQEVRFKQVELHNKLLDLFIDVPTALRDRPSLARRKTFEHAVVQDVIRQMGTRAPTTAGPEERNCGAATLLLNSHIQTHVPRIVLEGAPGQGKSTLVQYVCQIHRQRLLLESVDDPRIPESHRKVPVRIPFKIDLRDLALWLDKKNPFSPDENAVPHPNWARSLEAFLAAQVYECSGGADFTVADLHAVARLSAILLVCDGLDEVADIQSRRSIVDEIVRGVNRLSEVSVSLQTIVTSRPAAFANSPGLPEDSFVYFELGAITAPLIDDYAGKWLKAKGLFGRVATEVTRILRDKLNQPHLHELARNPMQLAILLSLIHRFGESLPDKRTALYDSYVELFFSREAEKSPAVREHRDLLIDIHRYLAWKLHSEAQLGKNRGSITADRLQDLVKTYLSDEQHDTSVADELFKGMVERVVALVSRVQGTYEFEVQPLREYFAARFLYTTAPYCPPGQTHAGTKPDIFDAMARDFYWLNVVRFYAGCYDKGELHSLVDRLEELAKEDGYRHTSHPHALAAMLLSDWVFTQYPKVMKRVVSMILDGLGLRHLVGASNRRGRHNTIVALPKKCGQEELLARSFEILSEHPAHDFAWHVIELIKANGSRQDILARWKKRANEQCCVGEVRTNWLFYGLLLGTLSEVSGEELSGILSDSPIDDERMLLLIRAGKSDFYSETEERFRKAVDCILNGHVQLNASREKMTAIDALALAVHTRMYSYALENRHPYPLSTLLRRTPFSAMSSATISHSPPFDDAERIRELVAESDRVLAYAASVWATEIAPWSELVEKARSLFGERWAFYCLANASAGIHSPRERCDEFQDLQDQDAPLCNRARYARLRSGATVWWRNQLQRASAGRPRLFTLLVLLTWAGPSVLAKLAGGIDDMLVGLSTSDWDHLSDSLSAVIRECRRDGLRPAEVDISTLPSRVSHRTVACYGLRVDDVCATKLYDKFLSAYDGDDSCTLGLCQRVALAKAGQAADSWRKSLPIIARSYRKGAIADRFVSYRFMRAMTHTQMPVEIAREIVENADKYPTDLVVAADELCRRDLSSKIVPVGVVAERDRWFVGSD